MFALARALVGGGAGEVGVIVEVGAAVTDIIIVQDGVPFLGEVSRPAATPSRAQS